MKPVRDLSEGDDIKHQKWKKVERKLDNGDVIRPTERVQVKMKVEAFAAEFEKTLVACREHFHEWQFQLASERILRCELLQGDQPRTFHHHHDLSENYTLTHQWAPQSTHWGSTQVESTSFPSFVLVRQSFLCLPKLRVVPPQVTLATAVGFHDRGDGTPVDKMETFTFSEALNHDTSMTARCQQTLERPAQLHPLTRFIFFTLFHLQFFFFFFFVFFFFFFFFFFFWCTCVCSHPCCSSAFVLLRCRWFRSQFPCVALFRCHVDNAPTHCRTNEHLSAAADGTAEDKVSRSIVFWGAHHGKTVGDSAGGSSKVKKTCTHTHTCTHMHTHTHTTSFIVIHPRCVHRDGWARREN